MEDGNQRSLTLTDIAHVSRNTPCGDWLRHYWIAIWRSEDLKDIPQAITVLGEELVLFRDEHGRLGLLGAHCCHRGVSLEYGDIEDGGIRCPYHGWLYDVQGNCLEQPGEPKESTFFKKVKQPAYSVRELGGLIFAYLGKSAEPPALPRYSSLVRGDGVRAVYPCRYYEFNWFNFFENAPDLIHAYILHKPSRANRSWEQAYWEYARANGAADLEAVETEYGMKAVLHWQGPTPETEYVQQTGVMLPNIFSLGGRGVEEPGAERTLFVTPINDVRTVVFCADFYPTSDPEFLKKKYEMETKPSEEPLKEYDKRKYMPFKGNVLKEDIICQATQGTIGYREEHLATSDRAVILLRKLVLQAIESAMRGDVPKGIIPKEKADQIFRIEASRAILPKSDLPQIIAGGRSSAVDVSHA